ncbi:MAG: alpha/beta hydrolase [Bryobacteraceae bacterium]|nr:alpha/beta hydrolase [Bryobacteraceae bacterium]MDW8377587.1 alpha/beta hydrolase [Bryobacterales bacterium]
MLSSKLDANVRKLLEALQQQGAPPLESYAPAQARLVALENTHLVQSPPETVPRVEDRRTAAGTPVRIYSAATEAPAPALVYFHGGGWVLCNLDTHDVMCRAIANRARAVVVSVDYRLAPEHRFPAAVEDCYEAACWVADHAAKLGIDDRRICVGGDSAGGNLAAVVCLRAREEQGPQFGGQILIYPVTDLASFDTPSYHEFGENHNLTRSLMEWFRNHYLADPQDAFHPYASPLRANDLSRLPPALVITAECDPLRDEAERYAERLREAGVAVTLRRYAGMIHPFFSWTGLIPQAMEAIDQVSAAVRSFRCPPL